MIRVSIDAAGGDFGPAVTIPSGLKALKQFSDLELFFVGDKTQIKTELAKHKNAEKFKTRYRIEHASEVVEMHEPPAIALRKKKNSSMRVAINLVKENKAHACVSSGNTGALMAISRFVLKTIKGIDRPAIMATMPTINGHTHMLDLGANIDSSAQALLEFATMGSIAIQHTENISNPKIGLLNVGEEDMKGSEKIKQAAELLKNSKLNYVGFIEGDDIFKGSVDVVVCDGFEGNIALKSAEGAVLMLGSYLKKSFNKNIFTKLIALIASPVLKNFKSSLDPGKYNGASLLGLRGIVIKSHGGAKINSFLNAIIEARAESQAQIIKKISQQISQALINEK